jgi:hypothetical protein
MHFIRFGLVDKSRMSRHPPDERGGDKRGQERKNYKREVYIHLWITAGAIRPISG